MKKTKIGFLPLYVELYDLTCPQMRPKIEDFNQKVIKKLQEYVDVYAAPICRIKEEFEAAVTYFQEKQVDAVVTMHLDYSPSLESADALAKVEVPIIVLDTTCEAEFGPAQSVDEIMYNHGIHGVQDMCNLLKRNHKLYFVEAGHWEHSDVIERVVSRVNAAAMAKAFYDSRIGRVGDTFEGMGDFQVPFSELKEKFGIDIISYDFDWAQEKIKEITDKEIEEDISYCKEKFCVDPIDDTIWKLSEKVNLLLRKWVKQEKLDAYTVNFLATENQPGLPTMPFLEISRLMERGIGYAGEGDVLTAALVGALMKVYAETTFTEMFCPDWKGNSIMLSHMGEINVALTAKTPRVVEKDFPFTSADNPVTAYGCLKPGKAVIVDLAPFGSGRYTLILSEVEMLSVEGTDNMELSVHGWFRPIHCDISRFLEQYSLAGGTHHLALVYNASLRELETFGEIMGFETTVI
ncbi:hypothetical protein OCV51_01085 [Faecalicatena acetigenes]|uniref:L-arabinose isomerase n=1 Tax=Faecalicatena acetigenes TaxID=2981790 RepID=A0ABT2T7M2_9FIRM|nr:MULTISPECIES: hypothetical protein [Lachnospiraceae]MCU6746264.1 hypothetical protein [Faecalicatena acetigenes]SCH04300.1 L-arabinose isomerase [uncultured Clostridium sp.]